MIGIGIGREGVREVEVETGTAKERGVEVGVADESLGKNDLHLGPCTII